MEQIIKQLKSTAKDTRLSSVEKAAIKSQLLHYMKTHPAGSVATSYSHAIPSLFSIQNFRNKKILSAFVIGGLLLGSTVSFAAENTVPGDALYPVKIHINEQVLGVLAVTPQAKADWGVQKAERRLMEVEKLAVSSSTPEEVKVSAEINFNASTNQVQNQIANFEKDNDSEDAIAIAGKLTDMLRKHERNLDKRSFGRTTAPVATFVASSSTNIVATTTINEEKVSSNVPVPEVRDTSIRSVFENVRDARGNAEKIQKDLKQKYRTGTPELNTVGIPVATSTPEQSVVSGRHGRKEEIRTMPSMGAGVSLPARVNEAPKVNEND